MLLSTLHSGGIIHLSNECLYYPICKLCGSYNHDINGHNKIISLERKINLRNPQNAFKKCEACGSPNHTATDYCDIEWFKRGEALQAKKAEALKSTRTESSNDNGSKTHTKSGCSRHMTGFKSYMHKYMEQPGPKVVFGYDSTCTTEGYSSIKCNGIVFTKVAFLNSLKYNLTSISQLCDAKYIVLSDEKRGTIFNSNKEIVMIVPRVRDVYVFDMTSSAQEFCFFAKASENLNWLWHKRLAHLNFKIINKLAKHNLVISLPSLVYSKDKPCSSCEKRKHHKANFKTKQTSSIKKCLHLLHMDLFGPVTHRSINHEKYTLIIVDEYSRVFNTRRQQTKETYHITFNKIPEAIKFSKPSVDNINIAESEIYPPDEYLHPYEPSQSLPNTEDIQISEHLSFLITEDTSTQNTTIPSPPLPVLSMVTPAPQDIWSQNKHIELVNIIDFLSEEEPKKVSEALKHPGWVDAMQNELDQFTRNKVWTLVPTPYGKTIIGSIWVFRNKRGETRIVIKNKARPDIQFSTCLCARYQTNPKESYLIVVKRIFRYLKAEAEYVVSTGCCANILWMKSQLTDYDIIYKKVSIFCDNTSAIAISNNPVLHSRTKHIDIRYHFIRDHILKGDIELYFIPAQYQLADIFTKPLDEPTFKRLIVKLEAFTRAPNQYKEYLSEFWHTTKVLPDSKIWVSTPTREVRGEIGYNREMRAKGTLKKSCLPPRWTLLMDYAKIIWEDLIHKLNKKTREKIIPYPRPSIDVPVDFKDPKYSSPNEEGTKSSLAMDTSLSHPSPPTLVVGKMHKEAHQAVGGPTSLGDTSEDGSHPQLSSGHDALANFTTEADPGISALKDSIP
nr:retrovirus-related Pol polyprotein from transposon TNT 1-94 [Tanacetum cinerariifolium]